MLELPAGWTAATVEELTGHEPGALTDGPFGSNLTTSHYTDVGPRVIRLQNIGDGLFHDERAHISPDHFIRLRKHEAAAEDIVVAMLGETLPRACLVPSHIGPAIVKADCARLRVDRRLAAPDYIAHALNSSRLRHQAKSLVHGVGRPRLGLKWLRTLSVPLAPLPEQRRITDAVDSYLTRLDAAVGTLERLQRNLQRYRASVLKAAVEGRLVPTEAELARAEGRTYEPASALLDRCTAERKRHFEQSDASQLHGSYKEPMLPEEDSVASLPEGWCWATTDQLFRFVTSGSRGWAKYYSNSGALFIRIGNLDHGSIGLDLSERQHVDPPAGAEGTRTRVQAGDVLISITADVGMVGLVPAELGEAFINQHVSLARPVPSVSAEYLSWYLAAEHGGQRQFLKRRRGATKVGLGLDDIRGVSVPLPPLKEQLRIVDEVERLLTRATAVESAMKADHVRVKGLRKSILKWAFEGRLVDQDPSDEPASVLLDRIRAERQTAGTTRKPRSRRKKTEATPA